TDYSSLSNREGKSNKYTKVIGDNEDFKKELIETVIAQFSYCKEMFIWGADYFAEIIPDRNKGSWIVWDKRESDITGKNVDSRFGSMFELCWSKSKHKRLIARIMWAGMMGVKDDSKRIHPTQKPTHLAKWFFTNWGNDGDLVVDLYLGSGSTMVAAHQLSRRCYGIELDPKYCDVIVRRLKALDPALTVVLNGTDVSDEW
ncbi:MAG: DNA methyltransferase, partial [Planktothrix sp.]